FITWNMPDKIQENWDAFFDKDTNTETLQMFGYGDGGSGVTEEIIELIHRFEKVSVMPETRHTSAHEFLSENFTDDKNLAKWDGELYLEMHRGTFTTKSEIKRYNRLLENKLRNAEIISVLRYIKDGTDYPADKIRDNYKKLMINQFHDILPGSHITPVYRDAIEDFRSIETEINDILSDDSEYYFNTLNFPRKSLTFIADENGKNTRLGEKGFWQIPNIRGLQSGKIMPEEHDTSWISAGETVETEYYSIVFNEDGSIKKLFDKSKNRQWIKSSFNKLVLYYDYPGTYDAWDILPDYKNKYEQLTVKEPLKMTCLDGETAEFTAVLTTEKSSWKMIIRLFRRSPAIEVENSVDWHEKHRLAKVEFAPDILTRTLLCDTSAGFISREMHKNTTWQQARFEACQHKWVDMSETDGGIAVINNGKYGVGIEENSFSLSLLRSTIRPDPTSDMGHHEFAYMILPHSGNAVSAEINNIAFEYNIPLQKGNFSVNAEFNGLYLEAMKLSENGEYVVVRLSEQNGSRGLFALNSGNTEFTLMNMLEDPEETVCEYSYTPFEIFTIGIKNKDFREMYI
ncbi:MAG: alpha-mannosidase, partial [Clostridiales bacterium]|nr:alpha-mannosidase [Clostridiales bacterium]